MADKPKLTKREQQIVDGIRAKHQLIRMRHSRLYGLYPPDHPFHKFPCPHPGVQVTEALVKRMREKQLITLYRGNYVLPEDVPARVTWLFPPGLLDQIREYNSPFRTARQVAERFEHYGVTRELLYDIANNVVDVKEADVKKVRRKR